MIGYHNDKKTLINLYPDNIKESKVVLKRMLQRTKKEEEMFIESDRGMAKLFSFIIPVSEIEIGHKMQSIKEPIFSIKNEINRARPWQVNNEIKNRALYTDTAETPAFPSGHSAQSYYLALFYSKIFPEKRKELLNLAENIGQSRIAAGLHYPSDHLYSKWLIDNNYIV